MNKIILTCASILLINFSAVQASNDIWVNKFNETYNEEGIDDAVIIALEKGALPVAIMEFALNLENLLPAELVKAMYCAGIRGNDIWLAAQLYHVSQEDVVTGYKKSFSECFQRIVDTEGYSPSAPVSFGSLEGSPDPGTDTGGGGGSRPASPHRY